jgi:predicted outer membrane repeat protein
MRFNPVSVNRASRLLLALLLGSPTLPTVAQVSTTVAYNGPSVPIPDNSGLVSGAVHVQGLGKITDIDLRFDAYSGCDAAAGNPAASITHTAVGDLEITLRSPQGTIVVVSDHRGGTRENICATLLDDDGAFPSLSSLTSISGATVSGTFLPDNPLSLLDGENPNGTWLVTANDDAAGNTGTLNRFSLLLQTSAVPEIVVDVLDDPFPGGCAPGSCSLREAVTLANSNPGLDRILLPAGVLQLTRAGANEDANLSGDLDVSDAVEIVGQGAAATTLLQTTGDRVLQGADLTLRGLRVEGGSGVDEGGAIRAGGVILVEDAVFAGHRAVLRGGAIFHAGGGASYLPPRLQFRRVLFEDNAATNATASDAAGGAIYSHSSGFNSDYARIEDCQFDSNFADNGGGALAFDAVQSVSGNALTIVRSYFTDNEVTAVGHGGALGTNLQQSGVLSVRIRSSAFVDNRVPLSGDSRGGAVSIYSGQLIELANSTFLGNTARSGAALHLATSFDGRIARSTFCNNTASLQGGAISTDSLLTIESSTFCVNTVTTTSVIDPGGGALFSSGGGLHISRSSFDRNTALRGGAITLGSGLLELIGNTMVESIAPPPGALGTLLRYNSTQASDALILINNILLGRCSYADASINPDGAYNNLEGSGNTCRLLNALVGADNQVTVSGTALNLGVPGNNGGPTPTRVPLVPSIAIDAGNPGACSALDQRGYQRTDAQCDVGAVEASGIPRPDSVFANGFEAP